MNSNSLITKTNQFILTHRGLLFILLFGVLVPLGGFGWLTEAVRNQRNLAWDDAILRVLHNSKTPTGNQIMVFISKTGGINAVVVLAVIGVVTLKHQRRLRDAFFVTLAVMGVVIINLLVRISVQRKLLAWWGPQMPTFDFGFPCSQAADTFAIALAFVVLAWQTRWRWLAVTLGTSYVAAVGLSRIYLGLHYPSDILAGWALALAWVTTVSFVRPPPIKL